MLEEKWNTIRKKCTYAFKLNRTTDQDELLHFMKKIIQPKISTVLSFDRPEDSILANAEESNPQVENTLLDSKDDYSGSFTWNIEEKTEPKSNQNQFKDKVENEDLKQKVISEKFKSCYMLISQSFNELKKEQHMSTMIHLCKKNRRIQTFSRN